MSAVTKEHSPEGLLTAQQEISVLAVTTYNVKYCHLSWGISKISAVSEVGSAPVFRWPCHENDTFETEPRNF